MMILFSTNLRFTYPLIVTVRHRVSRTVIIVLMILSLVIVFNTYKVEMDVNFNENPVDWQIINVTHKHIVDRFYQKRKLWKTSNLGAVLYKNEEYPYINMEKRNKTFVILIWKHLKAIQNRHLFYFGSTRHDPLDGCSVNNCIFTGNDDELKNVDAVIVHLHRGKIPDVTYRSPSQRWIFLNDESPFNVFALSKRKPKFSELDQIFNWSMTYRNDADVPVPYGRTVALKAAKFPRYPPIAELVPNWKVKRDDVLVAILVSNCIPERMNLIRELNDYIQVDVYGVCGNELKNRCPGHFKSDCTFLKQYLFYLVLENSKCKEYFTEKLFYNAYFRGAIPIIQGPSIEECETFLPPNSYIHLDNYTDFKNLAKDIIKISEDESKLLYYHRWRNHFDILNEHGYFGTKSYHLCRVCEAMNYNDETSSVYTEEDVREFLDPTRLCRK